jgi:transcriptional regulator with GAF, ATPase, and Fis domain
LSDREQTFRRPEASARQEDIRAPHLFVVLRCDAPIGECARLCLADCDELVIARGARSELARTSADGRRAELRLADRSLSGTHARFERHGDGWLLADAGSTNGSMVNGERVARALLADGDVVELGQTFLLYRTALLRHGAAGDSLVGRPQVPVPGLATLSPALSASFDRLREIAPSSLSVLIRGESGTGKELMARALHQLSRREGPFVAVNCGALPASLVESELFGARKGAFSGAVADRPGLVRSADKGTLFLDEIGDLPLPAQAALLRVLQEREVMPIGATRPTPVDVRWVAATHRDLDAMRVKGEFREDLLARIAGWTLRVPPLRERREDLGLLAEAILGKVMAAPIGLTWEAARALLSYEWPLNVRELEQTLTAAAVFAEGTIGRDHLPHALGQQRCGVTSLGVASPSVLPPLLPAEARRREEMLALFGQHHGNVAAVARAMGKAPIQVRRWAKRYGIKPIDFRR